MSKETLYTEVLTELADWPWGVPIQVHTMSDFAVLEYRDKTTGEIAFNAYAKVADGHIVDGHTHHDTLDKALLHAVTIKYKGIGSDAHYYIERMLEMDGS